MATRKFRKSRARKSRARKTVRRHRVSTAGKVLPPLDVRSKKDLTEFERRIKKGPLTIIMVWAPWCPHCHTMMPHFDAASKSSNRSIQSVKVEEKMLPAVNEIMSRNINTSVAPLNVEGYPSIIVVDKQGNAITNVEPVRSTETMTSLMAEAGPIAENAGINKNMSSNGEDPSSVATSLTNIAKNAKNANKGSNKRNFLANIGVEEEGLATASNSVRNSDVGEDELLGSIASKNAKNKSIKLNSIPANKLGNAGVNKSKRVKESLKNATAPSPLNTFAEENEDPKAPSLSGNMKKEAETVTSLASPLLPPSVESDMENSESISNNLTAEQKVSGGGYGSGSGSGSGSGYGRNKNGGSLYSVMARTTYTLAPAAALLATAALVMKNKKYTKKSGKTRKHSKKSRKTHKRR